MVSHAGTCLHLIDKKAHMFALERKQHKVVTHTVGKKNKEKARRKFGIQGYETSEGRTTFVSPA